PAAVLRVVAALLLMSGCLWLLLPGAAWWFSADALERGLRMAALVAAGGTAYVSVLWLGGLRLGQLKNPSPAA
ncbi:MAG: murein biosynthesis integral membrane protein MurJ, partial [Luminiphilus sp.]